MAVPQRAKRRVADRPSLTASLNAAQRAGETLQPPGRRLVDDPYACHLIARPNYRALVSGPRIARVALSGLDRAFPGLNVLIMLRARYSDDAVRAARAEGVDQVVLIGAGFDSTALRYRGPSIDFYEVDSPATQAAKRKALRRRGLTSSNSLTFVGCDLEQESAGERIRRTAFDPTRPCFVIWLGVSYYLSPEAFDRALADISSFSAPGSRLVVDYFDQRLIDRPQANPVFANWGRAVERRGEPYRLGFTDASLRQALAAADFELVDLAGMGDLVARYCPQGAPYRVIDFAHVAQAAKRPSGDGSSFAGAA